MSLKLCIISYKLPSDRLNNQSVTGAYNILCTMLLIYNLKQ
jgi:hypothetical protein